MTDETQTHFCYQCMTPLAAPSAPCPRCGCIGPVTNLPHQIPCGTVLAGKYLIGRALGQGGFGITYIAYDFSLRMRVAVKEFFPAGCVTREITSRTTVQPLTGNGAETFSKGRTRFLEEARALAQFTGEPGIVNVLDFIEENGTNYFVMEYIEGKSLKQVLRERGKLPASEAIALLQPVMRSLSRVHSTGLLHRDISPDNIMLRGDGTAVLIDFGAARTMSAHKTHSLSVVVKPGYAAPEQYLSRGDQGPWTDVYSLCATLYKLTTGKTPPPSLDIQGGVAQFPPPNTLGADFTAAEERAVLRGMSLDPSKRQQSVEALQAELSGKHKRALPVKGAKKERAAGAGGSASAKKRLPWILGGAGAAAVIALSILLLPKLLPSKGADGPTRHVDNTAKATASPAPTATSVPTPEPTATPVPIPAAEVDKSFTYRQQNGTVTITEYLGNERDVVVPDNVDGVPVTRIGDEAFSYRDGTENIQTVVLPANVTSIGDNAFLYCKGLTTVTLPAGLLSIGESAFYGCEQLTEVLLSSEEPYREPVTSYADACVGPYAFFNCESLARMTVPAGITGYGEFAFGYCEQLKELTLLSDAVSVGESAFYGCDSLTGFPMTENLTEIGASAFGGCGLLTDITVPATVKTIGAGAFRGTGWLKLQDKDALVLGDNALYLYNGSGKVVTVPDGIANIDFAGTRVTHVTLPEGMTQIPSYAFSSCYDLVEFDVPSTVTVIGKGAFDCCFDLVRVTLPEGLLEIGEEAFSGCNSLVTIALPDSLTTLGDRALFSCDLLTEIVVPQNVTFIGTSCFAYCEALQSVTIPEGVTKLDFGVFHNCPKLKTVTLPDSLTEINDSCFDSDASVTVICGKGSYAAEYAKGCGLKVKFA